MSKETTTSLTDLEITLRRKDDAAQISKRYGLSVEVAERIVEMSANVDQAHSIAQLMR